MYAILCLHNKMYPNWVCVYNIEQCGGDVHSHIFIRQIEQVAGCLLGVRDITGLS